MGVRSQVLNTKCRVMSMREKSGSFLWASYFVIGISGCQHLSESDSNGIRGGLRVNNEKLSEATSKGASHTLYLALRRLDWNDS